MKVFISSDIEGTTGITTWDETEKNAPSYGYFAAQMTKEVNAVCTGALEAGADAILIKDAHDSALQSGPLRPAPSGAGAAWMDRRSAVHDERY